MIDTAQTYKIGDCVELMQEMPANSVDLVVTSPPYDNLRTYGGYNFDFEKTAEQLYRVVKTGGVIVWVIGDQTVDGSESGTSFRHALHFKDIGFNLHDTMIWRKTTPVPQFRTNRYTGAFEYMFILSKGKPICNYLMTECKTVGNKKNRNNKGSFSTNSADRPRDEMTTTKENKILDNVWEYPVGGHKDVGHPAVFPEQLAKDHIISWSNEGDLVLDPFCGSGTVLKMCRLTNRNGIGFEMNPDYDHIIRERCMADTPSLFSY